MSGDKAIGDGSGPYDIDDLAHSPDDLANSHLDLGAVLMPVVEGGQVTVEMSADGNPEAVYLLTPVGRIGIHAFAAPRSGGLWREVVRELADSLRADGATTSIVDEHWGREVVATVPGGVHRFIGVDGPRWMVRCVASGPEESGDQLAQLARAVLTETVVRRGSQPFPPRELLPIVLPPVLAEQVAAAQQQMAEQQLAEGSGPTSEPLSAAPTTSAVSDQSEPVIPGGAVDQSASATVFSEDVPPTQAFDADDPDGDVTASQAHADSVENEPFVEDEAPEQRSPGSALSRFRRRRR